MRHELQIRTLSVILAAATAQWLFCGSTALSQDADVLQPATQQPFEWSVGEPLVSVDSTRFPEVGEYPWVAIKDPSIVRFEDCWHLFCTLRRMKEGDGRIRVGYLSFEDWQKARGKTWQLLELTPDYHGAPQVFYFEPQKLWYLIYQAADPSRNLKYGPCYSTNDNIEDVGGWSLPEPLYVVPDGEKAGLDYWVICDEDSAFLFFTSLNGKMWRCETPIRKFPDQGWSKPEVALRTDLFEASHTYRIAGADRYVTLVEAQNGSRGRYFKAFESDSLRGQWRPIADSYQKPFAGPNNVKNQDESWATSYSHGELIRNGIDQRLEVPRPDHWQFLFQGVNDEEYRRTGYGGIPWRLGLLTPASK